MDGGIYRDGSDRELDVIAGDRRRDKRYETELDLRWKLIRRRRVSRAVKAGRWICRAAEFCSMPGARCRPGSTWSFRSPGRFCCTPWPRCN